MQFDVNSIQMSEFKDRLVSKVGCVEMIRNLDVNPDMLTVNGYLPITVNPVESENLSDGDSTLIQYIGVTKTMEVHIVNVLNRRRTFAIDRYITRIQNSRIYGEELDSCTLSGLVHKESQLIATTMLLLGYKPISA